MKKEKVYTVADYYDGPRGGVANFNGKPHVYECQFDDLTGEYSDRFKLMEISLETLELVQKEWSLWLKWDNKPSKSKQEMDSHPVLPEDKSEHKKLITELEPRLKIDDSKAFIVAGNFQSIDKGWNGFAVEWRRP